MTRPSHILLAACLCSASLTALPPRSALAQPTVPLLPAGAEPEEAGAPGLLPEGVFLVQQYGTMRRVGTVGWVFIFAPNEDGPTVPPMPILPSSNLQAMEQIAAPAREGGRDPGFLVSGQVFIFEDRNYFLPTIFAQAEAPPAPQSRSENEQGGGAGEQASGATPPDEDEEDPSVEELLQRIESATPQAPTGEPLPQFTPMSEGLIPEGALIASRQGRLVRHDSGGWLFAPDVDADAAPGLDHPMLLLPSRTLEAMLREQRRLGGRSFIVSGRVFIYGGRNYLLPTMFVVRRVDASGLSTAQ